MRKLQDYITEYLSLYADISNLVSKFSQLATVAKVSASINEYDEKKLSLIREGIIYLIDIDTNNTIPKNISQIKYLEVLVSAFTSIEKLLTSHPTVRNNAYMLTVTISITLDLLGISKKLRNAIKQKQISSIPTQPARNIVTKTLPASQPAQSSKSTESIAPTSQQSNRKTTQLNSEYKEPKKVEIKPIDTDAAKTKNSSPAKNLRLIPESYNLKNTSSLQNSIEQNSLTYLEIIKIINDSDNKINTLTRTFKEIEESASNRDEQAALEVRSRIENLIGLLTATHKLLSTKYTTVIRYRSSPTPRSLHVLETLFNQIMHLKNLQSNIIKYLSENYNIEMSVTDQKNNQQTCDSKTAESANPIEEASLITQNSTSTIFKIEYKEPKRIQLKPKYKVLVRAKDSNPTNASGIPKSKRKKHNIDQTVGRGIDINQIIPDVNNDINYFTQQFDLIKRLESKNTRLSAMQLIITIERLRLCLTNIQNRVSQKPVAYSFTKSSPVSHSVQVLKEKIPQRLKKFRKLESSITQYYLESQKQGNKEESDS